MSKIVTSGKRYLSGDHWCDDNGPIAGSPADWEPRMTDEEVEMAARSDPDAQPLTDPQLARMKRVPFARQVRWKVGLSQSEFAVRFQIPVGTLRDWEQGRSEPDAAAMAFLRVILADPQAVQRMLAKVPA